MNKLGKFAAACVAAVCAFGAEAATWYVGVEGSDDNAGTSSGKPFRTVEKAVSVSGEGDEIVILPSAAVYPISAEIVLSAGITIRGQSGNPEDAVLQRPASASAKYRVFTLNNTGAKLKDLTVSGGWIYASQVCGGGVLIGENGGTLEHCVLSGNRADYWNSGGALWIVKNSPGLVDRCVFRDNTNCSMSDNYGGSAIYQLGGTVRNCLFTGNHQTGSVGGGTIYIAGGLLENCTIAGNDSLLCAGVVADKNCTGTIRNCLIGACTSSGATDPLTPVWMGKAAAFTNCVAEAEINDWCEAETAIFESPLTDNWQAKVGSAAFDGATEEDWMVDGLDLAGNARKSGAAADMGCYERDATAFAASVRADKSVGIEPLEVQFEVSALNASGDITCTWNWGDGTAVETKSGTTATHTFAAGEHQVKVTVTAGGVDYPVPGVTAVKVGAATIPVAVGESIDAALAAAVDGTEIVLAKGTHPVSATVRVTKGVTIRGATGDPADVTIRRSGTAGYRVLMMDHPDALLKDLTVANGYSKEANDPGHGGGVRFTARGGNMEHCIVTGCTADWYSSGGGVYITPKAPVFIDRCVFSNCFNTTYAEDRGGSALYMASGTVRNSLFIHNTESGSSGNGGTVYVAGGTLENCTVGGNTSAKCAGIVAKGGTVRNCLIGACTSTAATDDQTPVWNGTASCFQHCVAEVRINDNCTVESEIFDSVVADAWEPKVGSAAFDGATDEDWMADALDLAGNQRVRGAAADIGALECDPSAFAASVRANKTVGIEPLEVAFSVSVRNASGAVTCQWDWDGDGLVDETTQELTASHSFGAGNYQTRLIVSAGGVDRPVPGYVQIKVASSTIRVEDGEGIEAALEDAVDGTTILLAKGTHPVAAELMITKGVTIRGETGDPADAVLTRTGSANYRVMKVDHAGVVLKDLTIANGCSATAIESGGCGGGVYFTDKGGRMEHCIVRDCKATYWNHGGGVYIVANSPTVIDRCVFSNCLNTVYNSTYGGAALFMASGTVRNSLFVRNTVNHGNDYPGGTVFINGGTLENCTVACNSGSKTTGIVVGSGASDGAVKNTVIYGNTTTGTGDKAQVVFYGKETCFANCAADGTINGLTLDKNPFADVSKNDFTPAAGSAIVDEADAADWMTDAKDLAGNDRIRGEKPDIGCYEADPDAFNASFVASAIEGFAPVTVTYTVTPVNAGASGVTCHWDWDGDGIADETTTELTVEHEFTTYGQFSVGLSVEDNASRQTVDVPERKGFKSVPRTMYVVKDNPGATAPYENREKASANLADALEAAIDGVTIVVAKDVYAITDEYFIEKGVTVTGETGDPEDVEFKMTVGGKHVFRLRHPEVKVQNLVVSGASFNGNGAGYEGAGVRIENLGGTVSNCVIRNCKITGWNRGGGGLFTVADAIGALVTHCVISNCVEDCQPGNCNYNDCPGGGNAIAMKAGTVRNCLIVKNIRTADTGVSDCFNGAVRIDGGLLESCTLADNGSGSCAGVWARGGTVRNCLIAGNVTGNANKGLNVWAGDVNCFEHCVADETINTSCDVEKNPYRSLATGDYYPALADTVVDAATHQDWMDDATDLAGAPRVQGDEADIGCYELEPVFAAGFAASTDKGVGPLAVDFTASVANAGGEGCDLFWTWGDAGETEVPGVGLTAQHVYERYGVYTVRLRVYSREKGESVWAAPVTITVIPKVMFVRPDGDGAVSPFATRETAATNIQEAIDLAVGGCEVRLVAGTYPVKTQIEIGKAIRVVGETGRPEDVILSRTDTGIHRLAFLNAPGATLASVVMENGYLSENNTSQGYGAGVYITSGGGVVSNCVVRNCQTKAWSSCGGGVYIEASAGNEQLVTHCIITNCATMDRGNMRTTAGGHGLSVSGGFVRNTLVVCNHPTEPDYTGSDQPLGGAVRVTGSAVLQNCTIVGNTGYYVGGVVIDGSNARVQNCIVSGNLSTSGSVDSEKAYSGDVACFDKCVSDVSLNALCLLESAEVTFKNPAVGNYRLRSESVARDFGRVEPWMTGATDLRGRARVSGMRPDAGCFESSGGGFSLIVR